MALDIIERQNTNSPLGVRGRAILSIVSLSIGICLFALAYIGTKQRTGIGSLNQPLLDVILKYRTNLVTSAAKELTLIASPTALIVITMTVAAIWAANKRDIWRPALLTSGMIMAVAISTLLKNLIASPRPPRADMIKPFENTFSFPSGHTIGVIVFLLILGYLFYSRRFSAIRITAWVAIAILGTLAIAATRLYLGYHWLTDVTASVGLGLIILPVIILIDTVTTSKFDKLQ